MNAYETRLFYQLQLFSLKFSPHVIDPSVPPIYPPMTNQPHLPGGAVRGLLTGLDEAGQRQWRLHGEALGSQHGAAQAHLQRRETVTPGDGEPLGRKKWLGKTMAFGEPIWEPILVEDVEVEVYAFLFVDCGFWLVVSTDADGICGA